MKTWTTIGCLLAVWLVGCAADAPHDESTVDATENALRLAGPSIPANGGTLRGTIEGGAHAFKGVRYGRVPVRFAPPVAAGPVVGTVDAMAYGNSCLQRIDRKLPDGSPPGTPVPFDVVGEEDCLFLNVWAPADRRPEERLPVMFFVHGGAYTTGGGSYNPWFYNGAPGSTDLYNGALMAERGRAVVVTINYRLGAVGFMAHPALTEEHGGGSGNAGLEDIRLALQWVQGNIGAFGGDATRVMAFGESAGAWSVCALLASPSTRGLFSRAGMQSMYCLSRTQSAADATGKGVAERLGCAGAANVLSCMRSKSKQELMEAQGGREVQSLDMTGGYLPTVDAQFLPESPLARIKSGKHNRVPVIIGSNAKEASFVKNVPGIPKTFPELAQVIASTPMFAPQAPALSKFYSRANFATAPDALVAMLTDLAMTCPSRQAARALVASQTEAVYRFVFDADVPAYLGALGTLDSFHGAELFYLFQKLNDLPGGLPSLSQFVLERRMVGYWSSFGRTTKPLVLGAPIWTPYSGGVDNALMLTEAPSMALGYHGPGCDALDALGLIAQ